MNGMERNGMCFVASTLLFFLTPFGTRLVRFTCPTSEKVGAVKRTDENDDATRRWTRTRSGTKHKFQGTPLNKCLCFFLFFSFTLDSSEILHQMAYGKRRKGKHSGRSTPSSVAEDSKSNPNTETNTSSPLLQTRDDDPLDTSQITSDLIMTSDKRRGVYECDYCHTDISQLPRIRCAVCPDFDLCLDCFATTDHTAAIARLKAAASAHDLLKEDGKIAAGMSFTGAHSGISSAAVNHDDTHGYRVCDSTRYPLFPSSRHLQASTIASKQVASIIAATTNNNNNNNNCTTSSVAGDAAVSEQAALVAGANANDTTAATTATTTASDSTDAAVVATATADDNERKSSDETTPQDSQATTEKTPDAMESTAAALTKELDNSVDETKVPAQTPAAKESAVLSAVNSDTNMDDDLTAVSDVLVVQDDPKSVWTVEEDLRLLQGIRTHGLGNWSEISEAIGGQGSTGKTPRRCLERYFDDFLGRYGCILPPYMLSEDDDETAADGDNNNNNKEAGGSSSEPGASLPEGETPRSSKRRAVMLRSPSSMSNISMTSRKKFKVVPIEAVDGSDQVWPKPYLPPTKDVQIGQEVGRDQAYRAELLYVKTSAALESKEEVEQLRQEWTDTRLHQPGGPTVLPPRPNDTMTLPGSDLEGFMPRRGDFDIEWENDAEHAVADMEFLPGESAADKQLKLQVLAIYSSKLDEREKRKQFVLSRGLFNYRKNHAEDQKLPRDERDLVNRMRLFERFHTPEEHKMFLHDILKAKKLRKEIAKLQMYRRLGIRSLAEAEMYELDKKRRMFHKTAYHQKETEGSRAESTSGMSTAGDVSTKSTGSMVGEFVSSSLWKQYRTSDRKVRKSLNRGGSADINSGTKVDESSENQGSSTKEGVAATVQDAAGVSNPTKVDDTVGPSDSDGAKVETPIDVADDAMDTDSPTKHVNGPSDEIAKDAEETTEENALAHLPGYSLLTPKEAALCRKVDLTPAQYQEVKKAMIHQCLTQGLLDAEGPGSNRRTFVKIDIERRADVVDFMVKAGWISTKLGHGTLTSGLRVVSTEADA